MIKKLLSMVFVLCLLTGCAFSENLLLNADFKELDEIALPEYWTYGGYSNTGTYFSAEQEDGVTALHIFSFEKNDAYWLQTVDVKPETTYRFTCLIKCCNCSTTGRGANISIYNTHVYSESLYETDGEWVRVEVVGKTAKKQNELTLCLRLGGYSGDNTGEAWFRDPMLEKADASDAEGIYSFATIEPYTPPQNTFTDDTALPERHPQTWALIGLMVLLGYCFLTNSASGLGSDSVGNKSKVFKLISLISVLLIALIIRIYIALKYYGYRIDVDDFMDWGESMLKSGFKFYANDSFHDYPPVYMLLQGFMAAVRRLFKIAYGAKAHILLVKLLPILTDVLSAFLVYRLYSRKAPHLNALLLSAAVALSPAFIANSAAWGQADSILALLLCLTVYFAMDSRWQIALPVYALALLTKPQALLFGPIGLIALIIDVLRGNSKSLKRGLIGLAVALGGIYIISFPFAVNVWKFKGESGVLNFIVYPFKWLSGQLLGATGSYRYLTLNACNLYTLLDKNVSILDGSNWAGFSWFMFTFAYVYAAVVLLKRGKYRVLPLAGAVLMTVIFNFAPMMHERYLFPALLLTVLAYIELRDRRLLYFLAIVTATQFLNIILPLAWGMTEGKGAYGYLQHNEQWLNAAVSLANVLACVLLVYISFDIVFLGHVRKAQAEKAPSASKAHDWKLNISRLEVLFIAGVTAAYSLFAFMNLGATVSLESFYTSKSYREQITFDLGEEKTFMFTYFGGVAPSPFTVALSNDGEHWTEENYAISESSAMFVWQWYVPKTREWDAARNEFVYNNAVYDPENTVDTGEGGAKVAYANALQAYPLQTARYLRLTSLGTELMLGEVGFIDVENQTLYEVKSVSSSLGTDGCRNLIDEQNVVAFVPSYLNGFYFDEIYHARTAFEFVKGYPAQRICEWSHPHLGKLLIAVGIKLFGMTPFGWRFMGTLFGALMLPVMYLLIKQLTRKVWPSAAGMLLLAFDSMHFTQTRIATVDVYAVFFIMLMYFFMIRYCMMSTKKAPFKKQLLTLGLSGLFMGFAIASKWIGIYAACGLALIFLVSIFRRFFEYLRRKNAGKPEADDAGFTHRLIITAVFCVVMFIIVPALIYYLSYYWHFRTSGGLSIEKVWELQRKIFDYHKGVTDIPYFSSPWYEWPLIVKPMWYYSADIAFTGRGYVSSISCMGNPIVWWVGLAAIIIVAALACVKRRPSNETLYITVGFLSQYLPWLLVPRCTFIYHYFASVPFIIAATAYLLSRIEHFDRRMGRMLAVSLVIAAFVLFVMFYPIESGFTCSYNYALNLRWFNWYNFALQ